MPDSRLATQATRFIQKLAGPCGPIASMMRGGPARAKLVAVIRPQPVRRAGRRERAIELQERLEEVLLVPRVPDLHQQVRGIVVRKEDVVHVDPDAGLKPRQHLEKLAGHVAAELRDVARIDQQHVVRLQRVEHGQRHALDTLANQRDRQDGRRSGGAPEMARCRSTRRAIPQRCFSPPRAAAIRVEKPDADLDDPARLEIANQRVIHRRIEALEVAILKRKGGRPRFARQGLQLGAKRSSETRLQAALGIEVEFNRARLAARRWRSRQ